MFLYLSLSSFLLKKKNAFWFLLFFLGAFFIAWKKRKRSNSWNCWQWNQNDWHFACFSLRVQFARSLKEWWREKNKQHKQWDQSSISSSEVNLQKLYCFFFLLLSNSSLFCFIQLAAAAVCLRPKTTKRFYQHNKQDKIRSLNTNTQQANKTLDCSFFVAFFFVAPKKSDSFFSLSSLAGSGVHSISAKKERERKKTANFSGRQKRECAEQAASSSDASIAAAAAAACCALVQLGVKWAVRLRPSERAKEREKIDKKKKKSCKKSTFLFFSSFLRANWCSEKRLRVHCARVCLVRSRKEQSVWPQLLRLKRRRMSRSLNGIITHTHSKCRQVKWATNGKREREKNTQRPHFAFAFFSSFFLLHFVCGSSSPNSICVFASASRKVEWLR